MEKMIKGVAAVLVLGSFFLSGCTEESAQAQTTTMAKVNETQKVNPTLVEFQKRYDPKLVKTSERVYAASGYDYSSYGYIEGDDGVIVVDTGWFPGQAKRSFADFRKITNKPVVAIIYTHLHVDHYGGANGIMENENADIPVYGPVGWEKWVRSSFTKMRPTIFKRAYSQMGILLPPGEDGTVGSGVGPSPVAEGIPEFSFQPNIEIGEYTKLNISGVNIHLIPTPADLNEHMFVWLPDDEVLFVGDILAGTFPAVETARFELERDPEKQLFAFEQALTFNAEYIIGGHGRVLLGAEDVRDVMSANRDVTQFLIDQVDRLYINGLSADQVVDTLKLPPALEKHPDLQRHYHRLEWMLKTMHLKRAGFIGDSMDYITLTESEEAKRLVDLLGGADKVKQAAKEALDNDDVRWAARLATYALEYNPNDTDAKTIRQAAFLRIARTTDSTNERNYMLTIIKDENGEIDWNQLFAKGDLQVIQGLDTETILKLMKVRFRAEDANGEAFSVKLNVKGDKIPYYYTVRNNTLFFSTTEPSSIEGVATMPRETLDRLGAKMTKWTDIQDELEIESGAEIFNRLGELIE